VLHSAGAPALTEKVLQHFFLRQIFV
jgi:hypothetical protein